MVLRQFFVTLEHKAPLCPGPMGFAHSFREGTGQDAVGDADEPVYTLPGEGDCRLADCLRLLLERGYTGTWSIEPHLRVRPHENLSDAGADGVSAYVAYGRRLEQLVRDEVLAP